MKGYTFEFDISKVMFDEQYKSDEYETVTLYFFAPKEWLGGLYPEAISAEISVEYPVAHPEAIYATVMMSPTRVTDNNSVEDYDWYDIVLLPTEIEQLMDLAMKALLNYQNHVLVVAQDIDKTVALMCYIQLSLLGVAGYVKVGNSLTEPMTDNDNKENYWYTPMYFSPVWTMRRIFGGR